MANLMYWLKEPFYLQASLVKGPLTLFSYCDYFMVLMMMLMMKEIAQEVLWRSMIVVSCSIPYLSLSAPLFVTT